MVRSPSSTLRTSDQAACPHQRSTHRLCRRQHPPGHRQLQGVMSHTGTAGLPRPKYCWLRPGEDSKGDVRALWTQRSCGRSWREKGGLVRRSPTMGSGGASRSLCVALHFSWLSPVHQREACATPLGALCFTEYYVRLSSAYRIRLALPSKFPSAFSVVSGNRSSGRSQHRGLAQQ